MSNPIKPTIKTEVLPVLLIIITGLASIYFYSIFPEQVPMHWNMAGEIDDWGSKTTGAFMLPTVMLGIYILFLVLPYMDPRKKRYEQFAKFYHGFKAVILIFMAIMYFLIAANTLGYNINIRIWVPILVGLLFILIGNYMGKIKPNWFMGIRTPWTLSNEDVWNKTHRMGGKLFILGGLLMILTPWLAPTAQLYLFIFIILLLSLGTMGYSFWLYKKIKYA